jgi:hypothetical protein
MLRWNGFFYGAEAVLENVWQNSLHVGLRL